MIKKLVAAALHRPHLVLTLSVATIVLGIVAFTRQDIDAYPDISGQVVQVITTFPGRAAEEVEQQVTVPIERAMGNVPRALVIRSRTIFGLSVVQIMFEDGVEIYWARQRVQEKLMATDLPDHASATLGPLATAYGEVLRYELRSNTIPDLMTLRTLNDWVVIPKLLRVAGVADVANFGGYEKQYTITLDPGQLERYALTLNDIVHAIQTNNATAGGSVMRRGSMSFVIRGRGVVRSIEDIGATFINSTSGTPVYVRDVATIELAARVPSGIYSRDARDESVEGIVLMRKGENPSAVLKRIKDTIAEINGEYLPEGIRIEPFYDRTTLVQNTLHTVAHSVLSGITLVLLVLLMFLGSPAMAALVALTVPFALLFALILMYFVKIPIGLLSLGAIDFGIIVDGAIIMADHIGSHLTAHDDAAGTEAERSVFKSVLTAALEVQRPIFFSVIMIIGAYLPLLTLRRIEGLLFRPMAITVVFALLGALIFSLFALPALAHWIFKNGYKEVENPWLARVRPLYERALRYLLARGKAVLAISVLLVALVIGGLMPFLGTEFLPYMDEGVIWVRANFPEGTALQQTAQFGQRIRALVASFPDIAFVSVQSGRSDSGTDPFPSSRMELMIGPKPQQTWTQFDNKHAMVAAIGQRLRDEFPTTRFNFTQPIIDSVAEDTNGTSANLAVEFSGSDPDVLLDLARRTVTLLRGIEGAVDVNIEQEGPQPQLVIQPDRALCARYNVRIEDVTQLINIALGGEPISTLYDGERRFDIVAKFGQAYTTSPEAIARLPIHTPDGVPVPLGQVAKISITDGQTLIAREGGRRRLTVRTDIVNRDQGGFVEDAQRAFAKEIKAPQGYRVRWLGMFENLQRARTHFAIVIPITIVLIYILLYMTFVSHRAAILVICSVPFALVGGILALFVRDMHLNVSTGVGFAALFGVSIMNGVLMVRWIMTLQSRGLSMDEAIVQGAASRLRPILMASLAAILGLLPASLATGLGSDVQRPMATVIVWGLFSATLLTLFVVPVLFRMIKPTTAAVIDDH